MQLQIFLHFVADMIASGPAVSAVTASLPPDTEVSSSQATDTGLSSLPLITSPRTMTKQEAVDAGWFTDDDDAATDQSQEHTSVSAVRAMTAQPLPDTEVSAFSVIPSPTAVTPAVPPVTAPASGTVVPSLLMPDYRLSSSPVVSLPRMTKQEAIAAGWAPDTEFSFPQTMTKQKATADQFQEHASCVSQSIRRRGRPPKLKVPSSVVQPVRRRGRPPKSKVPSTSYHPLAAAESSLELEVARKFRAEMRQCTRAADTLQEFSLDPDLLPESATTASVKSEKSSAKVEQKCGNLSGQSSQENKNYLLVRTETTAFVVPMDDAVGRIVSQQEAAKLLCSQPASSSLPCAGEFSMDILLAACSQLEQSSCDNTALPGDKPLSVESQKNTALAAGRSVCLRRRHLIADSHTRMSKKRRLADGLVHKALRFVRTSTVKKSRDKCKQSCQSSDIYTVAV